jgi:hypothetical protein
VIEIIIENLAFCASGSHQRKIKATWISRSTKNGMMSTGKTIFEKNLAADWKCFNRIKIILRSTINYEEFMNCDFVNTISIILHKLTLLKNWYDFNVGFLRCVLLSNLTDLGIVLYNGRLQIQFGCLNMSSLNVGKKKSTHHQKTKASILFYITPLRKKEKNYCYKE